MSQFRDAVRRAYEVNLVCPKCGASNRPGARIVELETDGAAVCGVCAHGWRVDLRGPKPAIAER